MAECPSAYMIELRKLELVFQVIRIVIRGLVIVSCIWIFMYYFAMITQSSAESVTALAKVIEALQIHQLLGYAVAAVCGTGWYYERKGKKRAIKKSSKYQKLAEAADPERSSSCLTETGDTPEEQE